MTKYRTYTKYLFFAFNSVIIITYTCQFTTTQPLSLLVTCFFVKRMAASFTDNPGWIKKMKMRFTQIDTDKNGLVNDDDIALIAKKMAEYRKRGRDAEQRYYKMLHDIYSFAIQGKEDVTPDQFVEGMKSFVIQHDVKERIKTFADYTFEVIDVNGDGLISYDEMRQFGKEVGNMSDEMVDMVFRQTDINQNGVITPAENEETLFKFFLSS